MNLDTEKGFYECYPDNDTAIKFMSGIRWPNGVQCPICGCTTIYSVSEKSMHNGRKYLCSSRTKVEANKWKYTCLGRFTVMTNTFFDRANLSAHKILFLIYSVAARLEDSGMTLAKKIGSVQPITWKRTKDLKKLMADCQEDSIEGRFLYLVTNTLNVTKRVKRNVNKKNNHTPI